MATSLSPSVSPSILTPTTTTTATSTTAMTPPISNTPPPPSTSTSEQEQQPYTTTLTLQQTNDISSTPTPTSNAQTFQFPPHHSFPPFYTLQPNLSTLHRQLILWSSLITSYCAYTQTFRLSLSSSSTSPSTSSSSTTSKSTTAFTQLFSNPRIHRSLDILSIRKILDFMASSEGDYRSEWITPSSSSSSSSSTSLQQQEANKSQAYIWYKHPSEWGQIIASWVDETGQKGTVLTIYELLDSDAVVGKEWTGMDQDMLRKCLEGLVKQGKAQIFQGQGGDGAGVKFF